MTLPAKAYNPANWYWNVGGSTTQVYSSAAVAYVPLANPAYQAWLASGGRTSKISAEQDLFDLLVSAGVPVPANASSSDATKTAQLNSADKVALRIDFNHENRIRALEGKAPITFAQFLAGVKALLP